MTPTRRIAAYGRLGTDGTEHGGPILHGENPASAVVRLFAEQAGLAVAVAEVLQVRAVIADGVHEDRVVYEVRPAPGGVPRRSVLRVGTAPRGQRFAAYGHVRDPAGRVLLTRIAPGFPGADRWHLPGGGTDVGEQPAEAVLRELYEETGQRGEVTGLLGVTHRRNPAALGPEGYPMDWHAVRALYTVLVHVPDQPRVTEAAGGSTADAAWFEPADLAELDLTDVARWAVSRHPAVNDVRHYNGT